MKNVFILYIFFMLLVPNIVKADTKPDFGPVVSMDRSSTIIITDKNNVISNYRVNTSFIVNAIIDGNNLTLTSDVFSGEGRIEFRNKIDSSLYILKVQINVEKIKIIQVDSFTKNRVPQLGDTFANTKYNVLDNNNNIVDTLTIDNYGYAISKSLAVGEYCLNQVNAITNYQMINEDKCFTITGSDTMQEITLENTYIPPVIEEEIIESEDNLNLDDIAEETISQEVVEKITSEAVVEELVTIDNPQTGDNIVIYFSLVILSLLMIISIKKRLFS